MIMGQIVEIRAPHGKLFVHLCRAWMEPLPSIAKAFLGAVFPDRQKKMPALSQAIFNQA